MIESILAQHQWHLTRWGDGRGGFAWRCSCGVMDWGTGAENPERYQRFPDEAAATAAAMRHIGYALREHLVSTPSVERAAYGMYLDRPIELDQEGGDDWAILPDEWREEWMEGARAALTSALAITPAQVPGSSVQEPEHGPDWSDWGVDHPDEGASCRCGFNGTPEECQAARSSVPSSGGAS